LASFVQRDRRPLSLARQTALVVGLGPLSGVSAARALARAGARVIVNDARDPDSLTDQVKALRADEFAHAYDFVLGSHPVELAERVDLVVISPGVPYDAPLLTAARARGVTTIGELELAYRLGRSRVIAVTGTKGKSTTTTLIGAILEASLGQDHVAVGGNIGLPLTEITPGLAPDDWVVAEVSSFQLESIVDFRPDVAVVLNISPDHLDRHGSMMAYVAAKKRIVENQTANDLLVVNDDDPATAEFAEASKARVVRFSLQRPVALGAFLEGGSIVWAENGRRSAVCRADRLAVPGRHNLSNALAAAAVARAIGVGGAHVEAGLVGFRGLDHAYELVGEFGSVTYVDDSKATNLAAVKAAVETAAESARSVVLIMGGVDKGNQYDALLATLRQSVARVILLGPNVDRLTAAVDGVVAHARAPDMDCAVRLAAASAESGDVVLMSPGHASFDLYTNWKERGHAFQRAVRDLATSSGGA
jgi:UDP-N-acetylmuramoylalanine--D-glutamate ligase